MGNRKNDDHIIFHADEVEMKYLKEAAERSGCSIEQVLRIIVNSWIYQYQILKPGKGRDS